MQILLLNPSSIIARQRDAERHGGVIPSINTNLISLYDFLRGNSHLKQFLKVRIYNRLPGLQLHQTDSSVSISPFPPTEPASEQKRMLYQEHTDPAKFHIKWFMETWEDANNTIDLFDYMEISLEFLDELNRNLLSQTLKVKYLKALSKEYILALDQDQYELLVEIFGSDLSVLKMVHFVNTNISHTFFCYIQRKFFSVYRLKNGSICQIQSNYNSFYTTR
ncbi:hypothetical protein [Parafilimonas sp.]|uniref:hypothetical protein n=1 Tax=Parafilimonas sp. TaxID=1969739 RepID=UPI003F7D7EDB